MRTCRSPVSRAGDARTKALAQTGPLANKNKILDVALKAARSEGIGTRTVVGTKRALLAPGG